MALEKVFNDIASKSDEDSINLSPMIDMIFLLLLFFMVTTTFEKNAGIEVKRSDSESATHLQKERLTITIDSMGGYWLLEQSLKLGAIITQTQEWFEGNPEGMVLIIPDKAVKMDSFIQLIDELNIKNISNFAIGTNPPAQKR
ncbi:MAG: biopolymer transporter ExbD [Fibrobacterales bacterium]